MMHVRDVEGINISHTSYKSRNRPFIATFCLKVDAQVELSAHEPAPTHVPWCGMQALGTSGAHIKRQHLCCIEVSKVGIIIGIITFQNRFLVRRAIYGSVSFSSYASNVHAVPDVLYTESSYSPSPDQGVNTLIQDSHTLGRAGEGGSRVDRTLLERQQRVSNQLVHSPQSNL